MTKMKKAERAEAVEKLRGMLRPGSTVRTILRHVSRSGMLRCVSPIIDGEDCSWLVARALGLRVDQMKGGVRISGCGMDMGFHLIYELSSVLYRGGFGCIGAGCPSNDHSNGDNDYTPHADGCPKSSAEVGKDLPTHRHHHKDGGYALRHRWL